MLLASPASTAQAQRWTQVAEMESATIFVDANEVIRVKKLRRAWVLTNLTKPNELGSLSSISFEEFDCAEMRNRMLAMYMYEGIGGAGRSVEMPLRDKFRQWRLAPPGTGMRALINFVCASPIKPQQ